MVFIINFALDAVFGGVFPFPSQHQHGFNLGFYFLKSDDMNSTGIGKIMVEFFSAEMVFRVCR